MSGREAAKRATRKRALRAAYGLLDAPAFTDLSLEAVARAAGITRVTLYNHFGSRRRLLLALFTEVGRRMQVERIREAMRHPEPRVALGLVLAEATRAWRREQRAIGRLFALSALDAEVAREVRRGERARGASLGYLAKRLAADGALGRGTSAVAATELLGALTSFQAFEAFRGRGPGGQRQLEARLLSLAESALGLPPSTNTKRAAKGSKR